MTTWKRDGSCLCEVHELKAVLRAPESEFVAAGVQLGDIEDIKLACSLVVFIRKSKNIRSEKEREILVHLPLCETCSRAKRKMCGDPPSHECQTPDRFIPKANRITSCRWGRRGDDASAIAYLARNVHGAWLRRSTGHWPGVDISAGRHQKERKENKKG